MAARRGKNRIGCEWQHGRSVTLPREAETKRGEQDQNQDLEPDDLGRASRS